MAETEIIKKSEYPSIGIEIQGANLSFTFNLPKNLDARVFSLFLQKLNHGDYQQMILGALAYAGQQQGMLPVTNQIIEQITFMAKSERLAMNPLEVLKNKGE